MKDFFANSYGCYGGLIPNEESDELMIDICKGMLEGDEDQPLEVTDILPKKECGIGKPWKLVLKYCKPNKEEEHDDQSSLSDNDQETLLVGTNKKREAGIGKPWELLLELRKRDQDEEDSQSNNDHESASRKLPLPFDEKVAADKAVSVAEKTKAEDIPTQKQNEKSGEREKKKEAVSGAVIAFAVSPERERKRKIDWDYAPDFNAIAREQQQLEAKLESSTKKLKQDYLETMPTRHCMVLESLKKQDDVPVQEKNNKNTKPKTTPKPKANPKPKADPKPKPKPKPKWWSKPSSTSTTSRLYPNLYRKTIL